MKTVRGVLIGVLSFVSLLLLPAPAAVSAKASPPPAKGKPVPSTRLRGMIDHTLPMISSPVNGKTPPNRAALTEAEAEWTAMAQTAPAAQQPTYAAAANVVHMLLAAEDEHSTEVANYQYSKSVHGKQDHQDARISNGGVDAGTAFANNQKQKAENAEFRKEELRKEEFMNTGSAAQWTARVEQIRAAIEQAYTAELVTEKQMLLVKATTPPPIPPAPKPAVTSAATQYSPAGSWNGKRGTWSLGDDGTFRTALGDKGTWTWTDQSKRQIGMHWEKGTDSTAVFSADGKSLQITQPKGAVISLTR